MEKSSFFPYKEILFYDLDHIVNTSHTLKGISNLSCVHFQTILYDKETDIEE